MKILKFKQKGRRKLTNVMYIKDKEAMNKAKKVQLGR